MPVNKHKKYRLNAIKLLTETVRYKNSDLYYKAMVKLFERFIATAMQWERYKKSKYYNPSDRPRNVATPQGIIGNGLPTLLARDLIVRMKRYMSGFCHGKNNRMLSEHIMTHITHLLIKYEGEVVCISADGSNHDGHQHIRLMELVDFKFFDLLHEQHWLENALRAYPTSDLSSIIHNCNIIYKERTAKLTVNWKQLKTVSHFKIEGTVLSGSATKTTLGNTLRVYLYWSYLCKCCGLTYNDLYDSEVTTAHTYDVFILVSGDDVVLFCCKQHSDLLHRTYTILFSQDKAKKKFGLGQCVEKLTINPWYDIDFCSKVSYLDAKSRLIITRSPAKAIFQSNYHVYCSELGFMPSILHSYYVSECIRHELPGSLSKAYTFMRSYGYSQDPRFESYWVKAVKRGKVSNVLQLTDDDYYAD